MIRGEMDLERAAADPRYLFEVKRFLRRDRGKPAIAVGPQKKICAGYEKPAMKCWRVCHLA